jgi:hypothetical protein
MYASTYLSKDVLLPILYLVHVSPCDSLCMHMCVYMHVCMHSNHIFVLHHPYACPSQTTKDSLFVCVRIYMYIYIYMNTVRTCILHTHTYVFSAHKLCKHISGDTHTHTISQIRCIYIRGTSTYDWRAVFFH